MNLLYPFNYHSWPTLNGKLRPRPNLSDRAPLRVAVAYPTIGGLSWIAHNQKALDKQTTVNVTITGT